VSWRYIERPFLIRNARTLPVLRLGLAAMGAGAVVAASIFLAGGLPGRFPPESLALFASAGDHNHRRPQCHSGSRPIAYDRNCVFGAPGVPPVAALWGDSHGAELVVALGERLASRGEAIMQITASACPPALDYQVARRPLCIGHNRSTFERLAADRRIRTVVLATHFEGYPPGDFGRLAAGFSRAVQGLRAAGKTVIVVYPIPVFDFDPPMALGMTATRGGDLASVGLDVARYERSNAGAIEFLEVVRPRTGLVAFRPTEVLCSQAICRAYASGSGVLYFNRSHISLTGARMLAARFPL
jgi:hypothetical protein